MPIRYSYVRVFVLIIIALWFITLNVKPSNGADSGWGSLSGSGSNASPPQRVITPSPSRRLQQEAPVSSPPRQSVTSSNVVPSPSTGALENGRTIAVIGNTHAREYKLFRDWAGRQDSIELILEPSSLDDLGKKLETLGRERKISKLIFMGHGAADMLKIYFRAPNESTINEQSFITLEQNRPKLSEAFLPGAHLMFFNCLMGRNESFVTAAGEAFLGTHGGLVFANENLTRYKPEKDLDGNEIIVWLDSPDWYCFPWVVKGDFWNNFGENINRWRVGWTTIEIFKGHVRVSPIIHGKFISINSGWGAGPTKCLDPTEERVECTKENHWCKYHNQRCTKCPSGFFQARHNGVDKCVKCPSGMTYSESDNCCH